MAMEFDNNPTITLKIASKILVMINKYPDFTNGYTITQVEEFAEKHELNLQIRYESNAELPEDTIIKQDRAKDSIVTPGASLIITVAQKPQEVEEPDEEINTEGETTDTETGE